MIRPSTLIDGDKFLWCDPPKLDRKIIFEYRNGHLYNQEKDATAILPGSFDWKNSTPYTTVSLDWPEERCTVQT
jgi:hypothetical protein